MDAKGLGPLVFETMRAEDEVEWLEQCFVPPEDFARILAPRSTIIFGPAGSGKTAMYHIVHRYHGRSAQGSFPDILMVDWPMFSAFDTEISAGIIESKRLTEELFFHIALALLASIVSYPDFFVSAAAWIQKRVAWFIQKYFQEDVEVSLGPVWAEASPKGQATVNALLSMSIGDGGKKSVSPEDTFATLTSALSAGGIKSIWVLWDGLPDMAPNVDLLIGGLRAFLSTLSLFEKNPVLVYKLWLPETYQKALSAVASISRRRAEEVKLHWSPDSLRIMVEKRLEVALGKPTVLEQLCAAPGFLAWFQHVGGCSPRNWIDQLYPLVKHYWQTGQAADEATWKCLIRDHPPRLFVDEVNKQVWVGGRQVNLDDLPPRIFDLLVYLYQHPNQVVSKAELYYLAYLKGQRVPRPGDEGYAPPKDYDGLIDTSLWRLRKAIEPFPEEPVLLTTIRGHGVQLHVRW